jgi:hypothetical protein
MPRSDRKQHQYKTRREQYYKTDDTPDANPPP